MNKPMKLTAAAAALMMTGACCTGGMAQETYVYGVTPMTFAEYWYGEVNEVEPCDTFDSENPDLTAQSEAYLRFGSSSSDDPDRYAGVQKKTWDNDSGMYDVISRATVGYGIFRASFAHTVELTMDDGSHAVYSSSIEEDAQAVTGYRLNVNETGVPGIVLGANTRLDTEKTTGYTPDTNTTYAASIAAGGAGYRIIGPKNVAVKVKKSTLEQARQLAAEGKADAQVEAFLAQAEEITFSDEAPTAYAYKELYANGLYGARELNEGAQVKDAGSAYIGDGSNRTKPTAHGDGYADLTMFIYLDSYEGYTRGSLGALDEASLDTLYEGEEKPTYAENKEAADKLAGFMDYALHYQGAKLQWAGEDGVFDTADDKTAGNMLHKDSYFSFNHGNYIEVSITNDFARFEGLGNGNYRVTLISDGYTDVTVEAEGLVLDYRTPTAVDEDTAALAEGETVLKTAMNVSGVKVSLNAEVQAAYEQKLTDAACYSLSYTKGEGRKAETVTVCEQAAEVVCEGEVYTLCFDVSGAEELPQDIHYTVTIDTGAEGVAESSFEIHYGAKE